MKTPFCGWLVLLICHAAPLQAATYNITSAAGFTSLPATLNGGDVVTIQPGTYANIARTITANGTALNPVRIHAVNPGTVYFSGSTQFLLKGSGLEISGLAFDGDTAAGGPKYSSGLFRFDTNSSDITLRDCLIRNFNTGADPSGDFWIQMNGYRHTVEYCSFIGKTTEDPIINIIPTEDESGLATKNIPRRHLIRHCYFADRTVIGLNGYEAIRIGESQYQMYDLSTIVEHCLFKRAIYGDNVSNYEPEIISSKSRNNIYRYNTFTENKGGLVLRHGDDNVVEGNFFFGIPMPAVPVTPPEGEIELEKMGAGVRIIGLRHIVRNNYFEDIHGTALRATICLMKGTGEFSEDSTSNGYESAGTARIFHNTIINCQQPLALGVTTSSSGTTAPKNVEIRNNLVQSVAGNGPVIDFNSANSWTIAQISFSGNQAYHPSATYGTLPASGFLTGTPVNLAPDASLGYQIPQPGSPPINAAPATSPATLHDIRAKLRSGSPSDAGVHDTEATGTSFNKPLVKADIGPVFDGRTNPNRVPTLLAQPASQSAIEGQPLTLSVTAESSLPITYQWYKNEIAIPGAAGSTHNLNPVAQADAGNYTVAVTNSAGRALSFSALISVASPSPVITTQPASQSIDFGGSATFTVAANGAAPFTYQWRKNAAPISGATAASLVISSALSSDAADYSVVVTNSHGSATSQNATLTVAPPYPVITAQPVSKLASIGGSATFTVAANGVAPFTYQWRKNAAPISGATAVSLVIANVQATDAADYSVVITNTHGSATSANATLSVTAAAPLLNDGFTDGERSNQALPDSANWQSSSNSLTVASGALTVAAGRHALAFFKDSGVQAIEVGEQLSVSFTLNFTSVGTSSGGLRFGLFNSNGAARPADPNNTSFSGYDGYIVTTTATYPDSNSNASGPVSFKQRNPGVGTSLISTTGSGNYTDVTPGTSTSQGFVPGTAYTVTLRARRIATGTVSLSVTITGGALANYNFETDDTSGLITGFDGFAILSTSSNGSNYSIDNVAVVHETSPAPLGSWRFLHFGTTDGVGNAANDTDFDSDGLENLIEFLLGRNPKVSDSGGAVTVGTANVGGSDYLTLTFTRDLTATGVTPTILAGPGLPPAETIDPSGPNQVSSNTVGSRQTLTVRDNVPTSGAERRFMQLKVSEPQG